jgi:hypothetical protein
VKTRSRYNVGDIFDTVSDKLNMSTEPGSNIDRWIIVDFRRSRSKRAPNHL